MIAIGVAIVIVVYFASAATATFFALRYIDRLLP